MSQMMSTDGGRTDTKRFDDEQFDATDLIEGDRIDPSLVAQHPDDLGNPIKPAYAEQGDAPAPTQLVTATITNTMDDVHVAILVDGETGSLVRASRHDRSSAMSQKEADWKVRDVGTKVVVEDVHELTLADNDDPVPESEAAEWIEGWADAVLGDQSKGHFDYVDEITMNNRTLTLSDPDGRTAVATISLED